jgi:hypothetical protein
MATQAQYVSTTPLASVMLNPPPAIATPCGCDRGLDFDYRCCGHLIAGRCCLDPTTEPCECLSCGGTGFRLLG